LLCFPGMVAQVLYKEVQNEPNTAYPTLVKNMLPHGLIGILVASMLAALMSSLASVFNSSSTIFTIDCYKKIRPQASPRELVVSGRIAAIVVCCLGLAWIPILPHLSSELFIYLQSVQSYIAPPISCAFLMGIFWKRGTSTGALSSMIIGSIVGALRLILDIIYVNQDVSGNLFLQLFVKSNFLHFCIFSFFFCVIVFTLVSMGTSPKDERDISKVTWDWEKSRILCCKKRNVYLNMPDKETADTHSTPNNQTEKSTLKENETDVTQVPLEETKPLEEDAILQNLNQKEDHPFHRANWIAAILLLVIIVILIGAFN